MSGVASGSLRHFSFPSAHDLALARRYRPKRFADLLVQDHVAAVLRGAVARGRVGHGYLLTGPRGVGKTTAARILAMALNCPNRDPSGEPCGECENCLRVWTGAANLDVVEIDAASNRGVDDARDLRERAMYAASRGGPLQGLHRGRGPHADPRGVERAAQDAGGAAAAASSSSSPPPSRRRSRPRRRRCSPGCSDSTSAASARPRSATACARCSTAEGIAADDDALTLIARHADGGMRDALCVLDQCLSFGEGAVTAARVREVLGPGGRRALRRGAGLVAERRPAGVFPLVDRLVDAGADLAEFMGGAGETLRALLMLQLGTEPKGSPKPCARPLERLSRPARAGRRASDAAAAGRQRGRRSAGSANPPPDGRDPAAPLDHAGPDRGPGSRCWRAGPRCRRRRRGPPGHRGSERRQRAAPPARAERRRGRAAADPGSIDAALSGRPRSAGAPPDRLSRFTGRVFALEGLRAAWPEIVAEVREPQPLPGRGAGGHRAGGAGAALAHRRVPRPNPLFAERLQEQAGLVEEVVGQALGQPVRLRVVAARRRPDRPARTRRKLMSEASSRPTGCGRFRAKDPALDTAADALDLEIVD